MAFLFMVKLWGNKNIKVSLSKYTCIHAKSLQSCSTLCSPIDCAQPRSSVHGILQVKILEWFTMPFSRVSSWPRDWNSISYVSCIGRQVLYHQRHLGSYKYCNIYCLLCVRHMIFKTTILVRYYDYQLTDKATRNLRV